MAQAVRFVCSSCRHVVDAWSDGNPYYVDEDGVKYYAYHPDHERVAKCIGNDSPYHCLGCGEEFNVDSRAPITECPSCGDANIVSSYHLSGCQCPFCKNGTFTVDPDFQCIS